VISAWLYVPLPQTVDAVDAFFMSRRNVVVVVWDGKKKITLRDIFGVNSSSF
jgi:hypothetical protein